MGVSSGVFEVWAWTYSTSPCEVDKLVVTQSVAHPTASNCYQDDVNNEDYRGEESS